MRRTLFILLVVCALSALTATPMSRRAINPDEEGPEGSKSGSGVKICAPQTPCGWSVYNPQTKRITTNITNSYCECAQGQTCEVYEDDETAGTYVLKCHSTPES